MSWKIKWDTRVEKELKQLDKPNRNKILSYMENKVAVLKNPRALGKGLQYERFGLWRYRVGDYRIICRINTEEIEILVVRVGHRKEIYQ